MPIPNHTYRIGEIKYCQICNKANLFKFLDLGFQPLSDDLKKIKNGNSETMFYPLSISFCKSCVLLQNDFIVGDKNLYPKTYHYLPGITKDVVENFSKMSKFLIKKYNLNKKKDLIVDAGCNDGSLLKEFKNNGIKRVVGIDPTDTVYFSRKKGVPTIQNFFNTKSSLLIKKKYGNAKIITTTNVFAHTNNFILSVEGDKDDLNFCKELLELTFIHDKKMLDIISPKLKGWEIDRIAIMDIIILKMALTEMMYFPFIPVKVSMNEYIDIAKSYSTPKSKDFINGILDKIMHELKQEGHIVKKGRGLMEQ